MPIALSRSHTAVITIRYTETQCALAVTFSSAYGCPNVRSGLGAGWVFVILVLVAIAVYLFGGITYKKVTLGTSGKTMHALVCPRTVSLARSLRCVAHVQVWRAFPTLTFGDASLAMSRPAANESAPVAAPIRVWRRLTTKEVRTHTHTHTHECLVRMLKICFCFGSPFRHSRCVCASRLPSDTSR